MNEVMCVYKERGELDEMFWGEMGNVITARYLLRKQEKKVFTRLAALLVRQ